MTSPPNEHSPAPAESAETDLALRGLATDGIGPQVESVLGAVPGVRAVRVHLGELRVHVTFDPTQVTRDALRAALDGIGTRGQRGPG